MRIFILIFCLLFICSCAGGKPQYEEPEKIVEKEESVLPAPVETEKVEKNEVAKVSEDANFTSIVSKEGIPFDNIIPSSKEQVAIYKKDDHYLFYYFIKNKLIAKKNYSFAELDKIKAENKYPEKILKDLGVL